MKGKYESKLESSVNAFAEKEIHFPHNELVEVPLELIDSNPDNEEIYELEDIEHLATAISEDGFRGAIELLEKPDGRYEINAGHRRKAAMEYLHRKTIPSIIIDDKNSVQKAKMLLRSNINGRDRSPLTRAKEIRYYQTNVLSVEGIEGYNNARQKIAAFFNISESVVQRLQAILKLIPELQSLANNPEFPFNVFSQAVTLSEEQQRSLYNDIMQYVHSHPDVGISQSRIVQMIASIKQVEDRKKKQTLQQSERPDSQLSEPDSKDSSNTVYGEVDNIFKKRDIESIPIRPTMSIEDTKPVLETSLKSIRFQISQLVDTDNYSILQLPAAKKELDEIEKAVAHIRSNIFGQ